MKNGDPSEGCLLIRQAQQALCILSYNQLWVKHIFEIQKVPRRRPELAVCWHPNSCGTALGITSDLGGRAGPRGGATPCRARGLSVRGLWYVSAARSQTPRHPAKAALLFNRYLSEPQQLSAVTLV